MRIEVKLYSYHDMDLVSLYKTGRLSFPSATRQVLNAYADGKAFRLKLNPGTKERARPYRKYCHYVVTFDEKKDAGAIALLKDITPGCRNSFVKTILRQYLCCPVPSSYSASGSYTALFRKMPETFQAQMEEMETRKQRIPVVKKTSAVKETSTAKTPVRVLEKIPEKAPAKIPIKTPVDIQDVDNMLTDMMEEY